jgi:nitrogen regulatory protein PII
MLEVKRIEIIADYVELGKILQGLEKAGIENCTVMRNVAGTSTKGDGKHNLAMTMLDNVYIIAFCAPEKITLASESIRSILNKYGGSCFISDAVELPITKCIG